MGGLIAHLWSLPARVLQERDLRVGVGVGIAIGGHVKSILQQSSAPTLHGVDPYSKRDDYDDIDGTRAHFDELHNYATERLGIFGSRFKLIRASSEKAVSQVPTRVDFVYTNADQSCQAAWFDLCHWNPKSDRVL